MKKAEIYGQVFVYILMIVVFAAILIYGAHQIQRLMQQGDKIDKERFKLELKDALADNIEYGDTEVREFKIPGAYEEVCFVGEDTFTNQNAIDNIEQPLIRDSVQSGSKNNLFLYPDGSDSFDVGPIKTYDTNNAPQAFVCITIDNQKITVRLEGIGDATKVIPI